MFPLAISSCVASVSQNTHTRCSLSETNTLLWAQHLKCFRNCLAHWLKIACGYHILPQVEMRKIALVCKDRIPLRERQVETYLFFISVRVQAVCAKTKVWKHRYKLQCVLPSDVHCVECPMLVIESKDFYCTVWHRRLMLCSLPLPFPLRKRRWNWSWIVL